MISMIWNPLIDRSPGSQKASVDEDGWSLFVFSAHTDSSSFPRRSTLYPDFGPTLSAFDKDITLGYWFDASNPRRCASH
ncbi:unnamed protein product [Rhizoctonia solani]|uniref:Uncharacterized protein n=1 Tax=Rhizoctonia solani TaxID=456999 RepID=A0A8H2X9I3_9AGAM|nr:unnamed protein product [Rhizoctonia solani]